MKPKVLFLIDTLEVGGAEKSLLEILQRFRETDVVVCSVYPGNALKSRFEEAGIRVLPLSITGKYAYRRAIKRVLAVLRQEKPALIHTTLARSNLIGRIAGKRAQIPVVSSLVSESYSHERLNRLSPVLRMKLKGTKFLDRMTARWVLHFVANSVTVKKSSCRKLSIPDEKVSVIYRGRDPSAFLHLDPNTTALLRKSLSLDVDTPVLLNVARMIPSKGQRQLISAMSLVPKEFASRLFIAGEGPYKSNLAQFIRDAHLQDSVTLLGHRDDVPYLLAISNVFVFPSEYEGHPGSIVEAMFAGVPIIASDIPVHREMVQNQETALLVPLDSPTALAEAIAWIFRHRKEAERMGKRAKEIAMERFQIEKIVGEYELLYKRLLEREMKLEHSVMR